jgi:Fic family protein
MEELFQFINDLTQPKYDLLKTAIAHHRFVWVHPFTNGNGRTVRLLTYAMLIKQGFKVDRGRILNPTAVFCNNREKYNSMLSKADGAINMGTEEGALEWCHYVLSGLKDEIEKIDKLLRYPYLTKEILLPALAECFHVKKIFNSEQYDWLKLVVEKREVKAADFMQEKSASHSASTSRKLRHLQDLKILKKSPDAERKYIIDFCSNVDLTRSVIHHLTEKGFIPSNI